MDKQDRMFLIWGVIWFSMFSVFIAISMGGWIITATVLAVPVFLISWWAFCRSLVSLSDQR